MAWTFGQNFGNTKIYPTGGKFGGYIYWDGAGDYTSFGSDADWNFGSDNFTIDFWMYATSNSDERDGIVGIHTSANDYEIHIGLGGSATNWGTGGNNICLSVNYTGAAWGMQAKGTTNVCDSTWHHIALVKSGTTWYVWVDGSEDINETYDFNPGSGTLILGAHVTTDRWYVGRMDEFRLSKGIDRWTSSFTPSSSPSEEDAYTKVLMHFNGDESDSKHTYNITNARFANEADTNFNNSYYFDKRDFEFVLQWLPSQNGLLELIPQRQRVILLRIS